MLKAMINCPNAVKLLDPDNPNDNAFKLVITFMFCCDIYLKKNSMLKILSTFAGKIVKLLSTF